MYGTKSKETYFQSTAAAVDDTGVGEDRLASITCYVASDRTTGNLSPVKKTLVWFAVGN